MVSTTTDTKSHGKTKPKVFFNGKEVVKVHVEHVEWQADLPCEHHICQECCYDEMREDYGRVHKDRAWLDTEKSFDYEYRPMVKEMPFITDTSFLNVETLDLKNDIETDMTPIGMIECISVRNNVKQEISHLDNQTKHSLK